MGQRLGDLHDLLLADAQVADRLVGVDVLLQAGQQLAGLLRARPCGRSAAPRRDLLGEEEVVQHATGWGRG